MKKPALGVLRHIERATKRITNGRRNRFALNYATSATAWTSYFSAKKRVLFPTATAVWTLARADSGIMARGICAVPCGFAWVDAWFAANWAGIPRHRLTSLQKVLGLCKRHVNTISCFFVCDKLVKEGFGGVGFFHDGFDVWEVERFDVVIDDRDEFFDLRGFF